MTLVARAMHLFNSLPKTSFVSRLSPQGIYLEVRESPDPQRLWMAAEDHIGKSLEEVLPEKLSIPRRFYFEQAVKDREMQEYYYPHPYTAGRFMGVVLSPVLDDNGAVLEIVQEVFDIARPSRITEPYVLVGGGNESWA